MIDAETFVTLCWTSVGHIEEEIVLLKPYPLVAFGYEGHYLWGDDAGRSYGQATLFMSHPVVARCLTYNQNVWIKAPSPEDAMKLRLLL